MFWKVRLAAVAGAMAVVLSACGPAGDPTLYLIARPRTIDNLGQASTVTATAALADGTAGTGKVRFSAPAGSLATPLEVDLASGTAEADFTCAAADDPACSGSVRITAEWVVNGKLMQATTNITVAAPDSGTGGGGGDDAGMDAGMEDAGTGGGGGSMDGGSETLVLTPARTTIFKSVGDTTNITATFSLSPGVPGPNEALTFATSLGQLSLLDGGSAGTSLVTTTDSAGQTSVTFAETGVAGTATVTAVSSDGGVMGSTDIRILEVNAITHTSTVCSTGNNCTVMGIRNSGFNETATISFTVTDAAGKPLADVPVTFTANAAPTGLTISPTGVTNAMGVVSTMAQSGASTGTFTVTATVAGTVTGTSPTIGVRGAKPSNNGFTLQCAVKNMAAFRDSAPPLPLTTTCTVTLIDRFGNPVGKPTSVNLNSEAGAVPANISTTGYSPTGGNMNEGKGSFTFNTVGTFPPVDVDPFPSDPAQYPYAREGEPSRNDAALVRNPRDALVTIMAYTDGEEQFSDDNANGQRDPAEQFIDQGEPFLDKNDNNQWDPGESYVDVDGNNMWTPANGQWDANAKIWTVAHILYTDAASPSATAYEFVPSSFDVPKGGLSVLDVYMPDFNLNHVEAGASASMARLATKGTATLQGLNLAQDGYGFVFEGRRLVNATGTGPCDPTEPICSFRTLFGSWGRGYVGQLRINGAATTDMTPAVNDTITVTTTVRGVARQAAVSGTIQ